MKVIHCARSLSPRPVNPFPSASPTSSSGSQVLSHANLFDSPVHLCPPNWTVWSCLWISQTFRAQSGAAQKSLASGPRYWPVNFASPTSKACDKECLSPAAEGRGLLTDDTRTCWVFKLENPDMKRPVAIKQHGSIRYIYIVKSSDGTNGDSQSVLVVPFVDPCGGTQNNYRMKSLKICIKL